MLGLIVLWDDWLLGWVWSVCLVCLLLCLWVCLWVICLRCVVLACRLAFGCVGLGLDVLLVLIVWICDRWVELFVMICINSVDLFVSWLYMLF